MLIDTHSHMYDVAFDDDRDEAIARAQAAGVGKMLLPAVDRESYDAMFALSRHYPAYCRPMMGLHPTSVNGNPDYRADLDRVAEYLQEPPAGIRFCGVGEIGLDFYWSRDFREQQMQALRFQIELGASLRPAGRHPYAGCLGRDVRIAGGFRRTGFARGDAQFLRNGRTLPADSGGRDVLFRDRRSGHV